jgi:hypothetical protein
MPTSLPTGDESAMNFEDMGVFLALLAVFRNNFAIGPGL